MNHPNLIRSMQLPPLQMQKNERYLPSAFDESLSLIEKVNKVIHYLFECSNVTENMLVKWNEVYRWVMNEGLDETVSGRIRELLDDGTFKNIINNEIFGELNGKIENVENKLTTFDGEISILFNELSNDLNDQITKKLEGVLTGVTSIYVSKQPPNNPSDRDFWYKAVEM